MARDWVKLHTAMLFHAETQALDGDTFKLWVNLILLGGTIDDGGALGPVGNVAYALRLTEDELRDGISRLNGRVRLDDGAVAIRDWHDWQSMSDRDRKRKQRHDTSQESQPVTDVTTRDKTRRDKNTVETSRWAVFHGWHARNFGHAATFTKAGKSRAAVGAFLGSHGPDHGDDPAALMDAVRRFEAAARADGSWRYITARNLDERFTKWQVDREAARAVTL